MNQFAQAFLRLAAALGPNAISYMIVGSVASSIHGIYRTSLDVKLIAEMSALQVESLLKDLAGEFYADADMIRDAFNAGRSFNLIHYASSYKFDVFPLLADPYHRLQFSRRTIKEIVIEQTTLSVPVATAEDTLLMKLVWYRAGGEVSERQWNDVLGIIAVQADRLDREYLTKWAEYLKVADLLEQALA